MDATTAKDPVCGMEVDTRNAQWTSEFNGQTYYFCAPGCKKQFDKNPEHFVDGEHEHEHEHHHH